MQTGGVYRYGFVSAGDKEDACRRNYQGRTHKDNNMCAASVSLAVACDCYGGSCTSLTPIDRTSLGLPSQRRGDEIRKDDEEDSLSDL